jgi:hypothetical protein
LIPIINIRVRFPKGFGFSAFRGGYLLRFPCYNFFSNYYTHSSKLRTYGIGESAPDIENGGEERGGRREGE